MSFRILLISASLLSSNALARSNDEHKYDSCLKKCDDNFERDYSRCASDSYCYRRVNGEYDDCRTKCRVVISSVTGPRNRSTLYYKEDDILPPLAVRGSRGDSV